MSHAGPASSPRRAILTATLLGVLLAGTAPAEDPAPDVIASVSVVAQESAAAGTPDPPPQTPRKPAPPAASDPGPTPSEQSGFTCSPTYSETWSYLQALAAACRHIHVASCGYTVEGRPIPVVMVWDRSSVGGGWEDGQPKPVVLITACIHPGEVAGSDALQLLLRDIARGCEPDLIAHLRLVLVPILNVDGHLRRSLYHRFTQEGPACGVGTRRNALNLDLNRDYAKLESSECQAVVQLASQFQPDIFVDLHTDDGIGHQYDITVSAPVNPTFPTGRTQLVREQLLPHIEQSLRSEGFRLGHFCWPRDRADLTQGLLAFGLSTRYSNGYFETRQAISILCEAYPYVSFERRVRATHAFVRSVLHWAASNRIRLCETVAAVRAEAEDWACSPGEHEIALGCKVDGTRPATIEWLGKTRALHRSEVTGLEYAVYSNTDTVYTVPFFGELVPKVRASVPRGYVMGPEWGHIARKLQEHCIGVSRLTEPFEAQVELFRIGQVEFAQDLDQGHHPIETLEGTWSAERRTVPAGGYWVPCDQPAGLTAMHLLEPQSADALLVWNAFDTIFEIGIVLETWALEEQARQMLSDPEVRARYEAALADSAFSRDAESRLLYFHRQSPYAEERYRLYPVFRCSSVPPAHRGL